MYTSLTRLFITALLAIFCLSSLTLSAQKKFKVGIIPFKSDEKVMNTFNPIMDYIGSELGKKAEVNLVDGENLAYYLDKGKYDVGVFTVFPYLKEKHDFPDLEVFATHQIKGADHFYGSILCNKESSIATLPDLKDKNFYFVKPTSTSGFKYPRGILNEFDIDIEQALNYDFSGGHIEAIEALYAKECDAIAVDETRFKKMDSISKADFKELERYKVPYHAYVLSPKLNETERQQIIEAFAHAHKNPEKRALWDNPLGIEKFVLKKDDYYNPIRRYLSIVRVKPTVKIKVTCSESALKQIKEQSDLSNVIIQRIRRKLSETKRFSNKPSENPKFNMDIQLAYTGQNFSYQIEVNDELLTDGDVHSDSITTIIPSVCTNVLLKHSAIKTPLLTNGKKWFITYGLKDGLNKEDYTFEFLTANDEKEILNGNDIESITDTKIVFKPNPSFHTAAVLDIFYIKKAHTIPIIKKGRNFNIFSKEFWRQSFWDKSLAVLGSFFGISVFVLSWFLTRRKKKKFKSILYNTNNLLKKFIDGQLEMEANLIQQRENIRVALEKGNITENQYLILKHRLEELENLIEKRKSPEGALAISEKESAEIKEIVKDGMVTEKEFTRIMNILRQRRG